MKKIFPSIQVLRGVMFLAILAFHCGVPYAEFGWGGVEAFFVISAFFLVRKHWGGYTLEVKNQFKHRIARLYPPYIAVLMVASLYVLLKRAIPYDAATHLLSAQNFQWMITGYKSPMQPMTAHTWTLSIEVWCGIVWLFLLKLLSGKQFKIAMYAMLAVGIGFRLLMIIAGASVWVISLCPIAHFDAFACGSLLAIGVQSKRINKRVGLVSIAGIVGIIACIISISVRNNLGIVEGYKLLSSSSHYLDNWFSGCIYFFISLFTVGLVGLLYLHDDEKQENSDHSKKGVFVALGDNSYTLYLFHWPILKLLDHFTSEWMVTFPITLIISMVAALIFNWLFNIMRRNFGRKGI